MAEHNFLTQGPKSYYHPKTGAYVTCHSKDDVARAKEQGFTSASYVRSEWPKMAYHKKTGNTQNVGKLEWTKEQNEAAVAALGDDWTLDHVPTPEPVRAAPKSEGTSVDASMLLAIVAELAVLKKRQDESDEALIQAFARISELQAELESEAPPTPPVPTPSVVPSKNTAKAVATKAD